MIRVRSIMTKDVIKITPHCGLIEAAELFETKSVSSLIVVDKESKPIATLSENDIIRGILSKKIKVKDIMSKEFMIVSPMTKLAELSKIMKDKQIKRFPVVDKGKLVGIVTETDIIEATRDFTRFHQIVQDIILTVFGLATAFFLFYFSPLGSFIRKS